MDLLNILGRLVALEEAQASLLDAILRGLLIDHEVLAAAGALAVLRSRPAVKAKDGLALKSNFSKH